MEANQMKSIGIGYQDFKELRQKNKFYVDRTSVIREWWEYGDVVTLITRPRRFVRTLIMSSVEINKTSSALTALSTYL